MLNTSTGVLTRSTSKPISSSVFDFYPKEPKRQKNKTSFPHRPDGSFKVPFVSRDFIKKSTAVIPEGSFFSPETRKRTKSAFAGINSDVQNCTFTTPSPRSKKARSAITPNGTELTRRVDLGILTLYYQDNEIPALPESITTKIQQIISTNTKPFKRTITTEDLKRAQKEKRTSQKNTMGGRRAKTAARSSNISFNPNEKWHWMHLIAFFMIGSESQTPDNLVAGTANANYRHLFLESEVPYLLNNFPEGVTIQGNVEVDDNDVAYMMTYSIIAGDTEFNFSLDLQSKIMPNAVEGEYVHSFVTAVTERRLEKQRESDESVVTKLNF